MEKNVDENWKKSVEKEKQKEPKTKEEPYSMEADFNTFISSMAMEAFIFLGELPNPLTKKKEVNLNQAKYIIDTIALLKDKTKGNLTSDEANNIDNILYELRTKFIEKNR